MLCRALRARRLLTVLQQPCRFLSVSTERIPDADDWSDSDSDDECSSSEDLEDFGPREVTNFQKTERFSTRRDYASDEDEFREFEMYTDEQLEAELKEMTPEHRNVNVALAVACLKKERLDLFQEAVSMLKQWRKPGLVRVENFVNLQDSIRYFLKSVWLEEDTVDIRSVRPFLSCIHQMQRWLASNNLRFDADSPSWASPAKLQFLSHRLLITALKKVNSKDKVTNYSLTNISILLNRLPKRLKYIDNYVPNRSEVSALIGTLNFIQNEMGNDRWSPVQLRFLMRKLSWVMRCLKPHSFLDSQRVLERLTDVQKCLSSRLSYFQIYADDIVDLVEDEHMRKRGTPFPWRKKQQSHEAVGETDDEAVEKTDDEAVESDLDDDSKVDLLLAAELRGFPLKAKNSDDESDDELSR
ncbi:MAG: hypothetical protein MHM6MM_004910 [Cercozoa sp. M6MM]